MGAGPICEGCDRFPGPTEPVLDIAKFVLMGELFIIGGAGGTVRGLMGGDLLSPVSRRLFAIFASMSSGRSRFRLGIARMEDDKEDALGGLLNCCLRAISPAKMAGKSA